VVGVGDAGVVEDLDCADFVDGGGGGLGSG
jgi:hypothetical protein